MNNACWLCDDLPFFLFWKKNKKQILTELQNNLWKTEEKHKIRSDSYFPDTA